MNPQRRRAMHILGGLGLLSAVLGCGALAFLAWVSSSWGQGWLCRSLGKMGTDALVGSELTIARLNTDFFTYLEVEGLEIRDESGTAILHVERVAMTVDPDRLWEQELWLSNLEIDGLTVDASLDESGQLNFVRLLPPSDDETGGLDAWLSGWSVRVEDLRVRDFAATFEDRQPEPVIPLVSCSMDELVLGFERNHDGFLLEQVNLQLDLDSPIREQFWLRGSFGYEAGDLDIRWLELGLSDFAAKIRGRIEGMASEPVMEIEVSELEIGTQLIRDLTGVDLLGAGFPARARIEGPMDGLRSAVEIQLPQGEVNVDSWVNFVAPVPAWQLGLELNEVNPQTVSGLLAEPMLLDLNLEADGTGFDPVAGMVARWEITHGDISVFEQQVTDIRASGGVDSNRLLVESLTAAHSTGSVALSGEFDLLTLGLEAETRIEIPSLAALADFVEVPEIDGVVQLESTVVADLGQSDIGLAVAGAATIGDVVMDGVEIQRIRVPFTGEVSAVGGDLSGSASVAGASAGELRLDSGVVSEWAGSWSEAQGLDAEASFGIDDVSLGSDSVRIGAVAGVLRGWQNEAGELAVRADLDVEDVMLGPAGYHAEGGEVTADLVGDRVRLNFDLARRSRPFFKGEVVGDLLSQEWTVGRLEIAPRSNRPLMGARPVRFRLADGGVRDLDLALLGAAGAIEVRGDWLEVHTGRTDLEFDIRNLDLAYIVDIVGLYDPGMVDFVEVGDVDGNLNIDGRVLDGPDGMSVDLDMSAEGLAWTNRFSVDLLEVALHGALNAPMLRIGVADEEGEFLTLSGFLPLESGVGSLWLDCNSEIGLSGRLNRMVTERIAGVLSGFELPAGQVAAEMVVEGPTCDPGIEFMASGDLRLGERQNFLRYDMGFRRAAEELEFEVVVEERLARRLRIEGNAQTAASELFAWLLEDGEEPETDTFGDWVRNMDVRVIPMGAPVDSLARFLPVPPGIRGAVRGEVRLLGDPDSPELTIDLGLEDARIGATEFRELTLGVEPDSTGYRMELDLVTMENEGLRVSGHLPMMLDLNRGAEQELSLPGLALEIQGEGLPMAMMIGVVDDVTEASGRVEITGEVTGSLMAPEPRIRLESHDVSFAYSVTGVRYPRLDFVARLVRDHVFVQRLEIDSEPLWAVLPTRRGTATVRQNSQATLDGWNLDQVQLGVEAQGFWLSHVPMASLRVDGDVEITGRTPGLMFRGSGTLLEGHMNFEESWFTEEQDLLVDQRISLYREDVGDILTAQEEEGDFWDPFDVEFELDLDRQLRLEAHIPMEHAMGSQLAALSTVGADVQLDGENLMVFWRDGEPNLEGTVEVVDGNMYMLGRQFSVGEGGEVSWVGGDFLDPILDLRATKATRGYGDVVTYVTGSLEQMNVRFDSEEYPDQTDVLSILLLGKPASELAGSEGQVGAQMLGAALAMAAGRQLSRAVGSTFMGQIELDQDALKVGFPIGEKAFLELQRRTRAEPDENVMEVRLEWLIMQRMYMEFVSGDRGQGSADVYRRWRF